MTNFVTPNGKEIKIVRDPVTANFKIQFTSGGELPQRLDGLFTSERFAEVAVVDYLNSLPPKKEVEEKEKQEETKPIKKTTKEA